MLGGTFFRYLGGYVIGFWGANFFQKTYPGYDTEYAIGNFMVKILAGMPSTFIGGYIGDKYEHKFLKIKGYVAAFGALTSCIFIIICYFVQSSFYVSIVSLYFAYLTAEVWFGPFYAMINKLFPAEFQGFGK
jgi:MFS family permease